MVKCPNCQLFFKYFDFRCYYFDSRLMLIYLSIRNLMWDLVFFFFLIIVASIMVTFLISN